MKARRHKPETKAAIGAAQREAWKRPEVRELRTEAIREAWDDPLKRALQSRKLLDLKGKSR